MFLLGDISCLGAFVKLGHHLTSRANRRNEAQDQYQNSFRVKMEVPSKIVRYEAPQSRDRIDIRYLSGTQIYLSTGYLNNKKSLYSFMLIIMYMIVSQFSL